MTQKHIHPPSVRVRFMRLLCCVGESKVGLGARVGFRGRTGLHLFFPVFLNLKCVDLYRLRSGRSCICFDYTRTDNEALIYVGFLAGTMTVPPSTSIGADLPIKPDVKFGRRVGLCALKGTGKKALIHERRGDPERC